MRTTILIRLIKNILSLTIILFIYLFLFSQYLFSDAAIIFEDDFESSTGWVLTGEFEIDIPQGLGGSSGYPDPSTGFSGSKVLGVDLTGLGLKQGDYEGDLTDREYSAISPIIDCSNYSNISLDFKRWLNIEAPTYDHAYIDIWDNSNWTEVWTNDYTVADTVNWGNWRSISFDISEYADFNDEVKIRFSLGATDNADFFSGWNIDDFSIVGYETVSAPDPTISIAPIDSSLGNNVFGELEWEMVGNATGYKIYFGSDGDGIDTPTNLIDGFEISETHYSFSNVESNVTYYWQIVPYNSFGDAVDCEIWRFSTIDNLWGNVAISPLNFDFLLGNTNPTFVDTVFEVTNNWTDTTINYTAEVSIVHAEKFDKKDRSMWDIQFNYDVTTLSGIESQAGVESDGEFFYTCQWNSNGILKFNLDGSFVELFTISGVSNLRDLAYDGQYFYGGNGTNLIWKMDFNLKTLVDTITYTGDGTRSIAYDSSEDAFWINNWSSNMILVDRTGAVLETLSVNAGNIYGSAYDNYSDGGPYLWVHSGGGAGEIAEIKQINLSSDSLTVVNHTNYSTANAGGMFLMRDFVLGTVTLGVLAQGDAVYGFEVSGIEWITLENNIGTIEPDSTVEIPILINFLGFKNSLKDSTITQIDLNAIIRLKDENNIYSSDTITIHIDYTSIVGIEDDNYELRITNYELKQNYPNPFNPVTKINYELRITNYELAEIVVYNAMGQSVWSQNLSTDHSSPITDYCTFDGSKFNSGVYYYSLVVDGKRLSTKSMVLIK